MPGPRILLPPTLDQWRRKKAAHNLSRHATMAIQAAYPEHLFTVEVDPDHGHIFIDHPLLKHAKARYFLPFDRYDDGKGAVRLAGEILERVGLRRGELKHYEDYDVVEGLARTQFSAR